MKKRVLYFLCCMLLILTFDRSVSSNNRTISGFVKDESNGESLIAVNVFLKDTSIGTITNKSGYYIISSVPPGLFTVVFSYIGYEQKEIEVNVEKKFKRILNVTLKPKVLKTQEIVVTSERETKEKEVKISTMRLTARSLKKAPQMAEADLMRILQMLPGVLTLSEFSSGLYVRGGTPDQNLILLDGTEVYNANHLFGIFSTFDVDAVKEVELMKGGFPAEYGGRLSSVLNITNKDGNQKEFEGKASIGLISTKTTLQGPVGKGAWFFSGRRTYIDYIINAAERNAKGSLKESLKIIPDYYFYDLHFKLYQDFGHQDKLALTFYRGQDVLNFSYDPFEFTFQWGNKVFTGKWTHIFNEKLFTNFYATISNYKVLVDRDDAFFTGRFDNAVNDVTIRTDIEYFPTNRHVVKFGLIYKNLGADFFQKLNKQELLFTSGGSQISSYLQDNWKITPLLRLRYGIRVNFYLPDVFVNTYDRVRFQSENRFDFEPRFAFRYRLTENTTLKGSWGRYFQYINIVPFGNADFSFLDVWFPSDNSYEPGEAYHYILGFETELPFNLQLDSEVYYKNMHHLCEFIPGVNEVLEGKDLFYSGNGYAYGTDFYFEKKIGKFTGWLSYFWSCTKRKFPEINNGKEYFPKYDRRNSFNIIGNYQFNNRWSLNFAWTYGTGQAYTQPVGHYQLKWLENKLYLVQGEQKNISRLPAYHRFDIGVRYERNVNKLFLNKWTFYLQIFNLYNRQNTWFRNVDFKEDLPPEAIEVGMLPIVPTLGFEFYF